MGFSFLTPAKDHEKGNKFLNLTKAINRHILRSPGRRENNNFSPSGLGRLCPREYVFNHYLQRYYPPSDFKSGFYFKVGHVAHERLQNEVLAPMGLLYGTWVKKDGKKEDRVQNSYWPGKGYKFVETKITAEVAEGVKIAGYLDGLIDANRYKWVLEGCKGDFPEPSDQFVIWEFKTMNDYSYKGVRTFADIPESYKMQTEMYQHITGARTTLFCIINSGTWDKRFIEYNYSGEWYTAAKTKILVSLEGVKNQTLPEAFRACESPTCSRAKACPYAKECFSEFDLSRWVEENPPEAPLETKECPDPSPEN